MPGSTVHVTNLPPLEPLEDARRPMSPELAQYFKRFLDVHTIDDDARGLIREFLADDRLDLALTVLLIAVLGGAKAAD
jgi:hypothetical protein